MKNLLQQNLGRNIPTEVLAELKARPAYIGVNSAGVRIISPLELAERIGESRLVKGVDCTFEVQDGRVPEWDAQTGAWLGYTVHPDWFRGIVPLVDGRRRRGLLPLLRGI